MLTESPVRATVLEWRCWKCRGYLGDRAPDAYGVVIRCAKCGKRNPLPPVTSEQVQ